MKGKNSTTKTPTTIDDLTEENNSSFIKGIKRKKGNPFSDVNLTYQFNSSCNLKCPGCYIPEKQGTNLDEDEAINVLHGFNNIKKVLLLGAEIATTPKLTNKLLRKLRDDGTTAKLITNGFASRDVYGKIIDGIKPEDIDKITVSIDSIIPEIHDLIRGKQGALTKSLETISYFQDKGYAIRAQLTIGNINADSTIETIHELYNRYHIRNFAVHCQSIEGNPQTSIKHIDPFRWRGIVEELKKVKQGLDTGEFTVPLIALYEDELTKDYLGKEYSEEFLDPDRKDKPLSFDMCRGLNEENFYIIGSKNNIRNSICQILSFAKQTYHSRFDNDKKRFIMNDDPETSDISAIERSPFLCPPQLEMTGCKKPYVQDKHGEKLYWVCRYYTGKK